ncbi:zinc-binding dehydrogenase [Nonomuraea salmonea]|uniref:zinc-binding dehydrogenase n=1 Tax=Nonomuraea salmonea TaxID=46181 RepID=UPI002FE7B80B
METLVEVPDEVSSRQAAALLQVGPAALSLVGAAELKPGAKVLVTGGRWGAGAGRRTAGAGGRRPRDGGGARPGQASCGFCRGGADVVIGYQEFAGPVEVVFDGVGGEVGGAAFELLGPGGRFFAYGVPSGSVALIDPAEAARRGVRVVGMEQVQFAPDTFRELAGQALREAAAGRLVAEIGLEVPLERAAEAHAALEGRRLVGKALLLVSDQHGDAIAAPSLPR